MTAIIFHWQSPDILNTPKAQKKLLARWSLTCKAFKVYDIYCVTDEDTQIKDAEVNFTKCATLGEAIALAGGTPIYLEEGGSPLTEFSHPEDGTYIFGADYVGLHGVEDVAITINALLPLWAEQACGIVLEHRYQQWS